MELDRHARGTRRNAGNSADLVSRPARHLERRERVDHQRRREPASSGTVAERASADQCPLHLDDRQTGWPPLFRQLFVAAIQRIGYRRHNARRQPVVCRHRRLCLRYLTRTGPARGLLSPDRHIWTGSVLYRADETAVTQGAKALLLWRNQACSVRLRRSLSLLSADQTSSTL